MKDNETYTLQLSQTSENCLRKLYNINPESPLFFTKKEHADLYFQDCYNATNVLSNLSEIRKNIESHPDYELDEVRNTFSEFRKQCSYAHGRKPISRKEQMAKINEEVNARLGIEPEKEDDIERD